MAKNECSGDVAAVSVYPWNAIKLSWITTVCHITFIFYPMALGFLISSIFLNAFACHGSEL